MGGSGDSKTELRALGLHCRHYHMAVHVSLGIPGLHFSHVKSENANIYLFFVCEFVCWNQITASKILWKYILKCNTRDIWEYVWKLRFFFFLMYWGGHLLSHVIQTMDGPSIESWRASVVLFSLNPSHRTKSCLPWDSCHGPVCRDVPVPPNFLALFSTFFMSLQNYNYSPLH